ncbi:MAG: ABC transporter ATP-binding protein [Aeromonas sp.]
MLSIEQLSIVRGSGEQAHRVCLPSLTLPLGQVVAVTGESGCGKSTLLEVIGLLLNPTQVHRFEMAFIDESPAIADIAHLQASNDQKALAAIRAARIGFMLQSGGLLPFLSVRDNIRLPCQLLGISEDQQLLRRAIHTLKLEGLLHKKPAQLSIGERQRVAFVRAIAHRPKLLLADEPTASLDPHTAKLLFALFIELVEEWGIAALVASHDWGLVHSFGLPCLKAHLTQGETHFAFS